MNFCFSFSPCLLYRHKWILLTHISLTTVCCKWDVMSVVWILFYWLCMHPVALHGRRQVGEDWVVIAFHICCLLIKGIKIPFCLSSQRKVDWGDLFFCLSSSLLHFLLYFDNQVAWFVIIPTFSSFMKVSFKLQIILKKTTKMRMNS